MSADAGIIACKTEHSAERSIAAPSFDFEIRQMKKHRKVQRKNFKDVLDAPEKIVYCNDNKEIPYFY